MTDSERAVMAHLATFISEHKKEVIQRNLSLRSNHIVAVIEDIYQSQNASAVIRTCDCVGMQTVYVIENNNEYILNPDVTRGSSKWVTIERFSAESDSNTQACFSHLRSSGYQIVGTTIDTDAESVFDLDVTQKTALVFGNELNGLSDICVSSVDKLVHIPMYGFTESFNVSVSAAIALYPLYEKVRSLPVNWQLSFEEKETLKLEWFRKIVSRSDIIEKEFLKNN